MSVVRRVFALLLASAIAVAAAAALASCGGDGGGGGGVKLLPKGEYFPTVSGTIEFTLPVESASSVVVGMQTQTANVSGTATINMGEGGSFDIKEWASTARTIVIKDTIK